MFLFLISAFITGPIIFMLKDLLKGKRCSIVLYDSLRPFCFFMAVVFNIYIYRIWDLTEIGLPGRDVNTLFITVCETFFFALAGAFFNKKRFYWERTEKMLQNEEVLRLMKK